LPGRKDTARFTVIASQREAVRRYIERQAEHHRTRTFHDEYVELLRRHGVESMNVMFNPTPSPGLDVFVSGKPVVYITG